MTDEQWGAITELQEDEDFAFSFSGKDEPLVYPFYDVTGLLNVAVIQPSGQITRILREGQ